MDKYHDYALACTRHLSEFVHGLVRRDQEEEVFAGMYARVKATLEVFDAEAGGAPRHAGPSNN